jgi:anti-anti-sigma factor
MDDCAGASGLLPLTCTSSRPRPDVCVVRPVGELDIATAPLLAEYLREHSADRPAELVLDLSGVTLLAAPGVAVIVGAAHHRDDVHGRLHLTGVAGNRPVEQVLDLTGVAALVDVRPTVAALLAELEDH